MARLGIWQKFAGAQRGTTGNFLDKKTVHHVEETVKYSPEDGDLYVVRSSPKLQPYKTDVEVNGKIL